MANKSKSNSKTNTTKSTKTQAVSPPQATKQHTSHRNQIAIITAVIIGLLIIAGTTAISILCLPKISESSTDVATNNSADEVTVYKPVEIAQTTENSESKTDTTETSTEGSKDTANNSTSTSNKTTSTNQSTNTTVPSVSTKKPTTNSSTSNTNTNTTQPTTNTPAPTFVKYIEDVTKSNVVSKYGTSCWTEKKVIYDLYSDGSKKLNSTSTYNKCDYSGYNGTTAQIKSEAIQQKSAERTNINQILTATNSYRTEVGATPLTLDEDLTTAAEIRAIEMAWSNVFAHQRPNGNSIWGITSELGIPGFYGENIAYSSSANGTAMAKIWRNSAGHYANMIDTAFTKIGIGFYRFQGATYAVQLFR